MLCCTLDYVLTGILHYELAVVLDVALTIALFVPLAVEMVFALDVVLDVFAWFMFFYYGLVYGSWFRVPFVVRH